MLPSYLQDLRRAFVRALERFSSWLVHTSQTAHFFTRFYGGGRGCSGGSGRASEWELESADEARCAAPRQRRDVLGVGADMAGGQRPHRRLQHVSRSRRGRRVDPGGRLRRGERRRARVDMCLLPALGVRRGGLRSGNQEGGHGARDLHSHGPDRVHRHPPPPRPRPGSRRHVHPGDRRVGRRGPARVRGVRDVLQGGFAPGRGRRDVHGGVGGRGGRDGGEE